MTADKSHRALWRRLAHRYRLQPIPIGIYPLGAAPLLCLLTWHWRDAGLGWIAFPSYWLLIIGCAVAIPFFMFIGGLQLLTRTCQAKMFALPLISVTIGLIALLCNRVDIAMFTFYGFALPGYAIKRPKRDTWQGWVIAALSTASAIAFWFGNPWVVLVLVVIPWIVAQLGRPRNWLVLRISKLGTARERSESKDYTAHLWMYPDEIYADIAQLCMAERWQEANELLKVVVAKKHLKSYYLGDFPLKIAVGLQDYEKVLMIIGQKGDKKNRYGLEQVTALIGLGKYEKAQQVAAEAVSKRFHNHQSAMGDVLVALGSTSDALLWYDRACMIFGAYPGLQRSGCLLMKLGDYTEARACFERAIREGNVLNLNDLRSLAECYHHLGRERESVAILEIIRRREPTTN